MDIQVKPCLSFVACNIYLLLLTSFLWMICCFVRLVMQRNRLRLLMKCFVIVAFPFFHYCTLLERQMHDIYIFKYSQKGNKHRYTYHETIGNWLYYHCCKRPKLFSILLHNRSLYHKTVYCFIPLILLTCHIYEKINNYFFLQASTVSTNKNYVWWIVSYGLCCLLGNVCHCVRGFKC